MMSNFTSKSGRNSAMIIVLLSVLIVSCSKKKTNTKLYDEAKASGLSYYKGKDTIYGPKAESPHGNFKLKFNSTAVSDLDASGKLPVGGSFSNGALIVKEVYSGSEISRYVVMKKDPKSKFASSKWLWAEYEPDGKILYDVSKEGADCKSCHSGSTRDMTRSFDLH